MSPSRRAGHFTLGLAIAGLGLVAVGVILWSSAPAEFGWFSYGPVDEGFLSQLVFMPGRRWVALAAAVSGLMLVAGVLGFRLGLGRGALPRGE